MSISISESTLIFILSCFLLFNILFVIFLLLEVNELKKQTGCLFTTMSTLSQLENYNLELIENVNKVLPEIVDDTDEEVKDNIDSALYTKQG